MAIIAIGGYQIAPKDVTSIDVVQSSKAPESEVAISTFSVTLPGGVVSPVFSGEDSVADADAARNQLIAALDPASIYRCLSEAVLVLTQIAALSPVSVTGDVDGVESYGFNVVLHGASSTLSYSDEATARTAYGKLLSAWSELEG